MCQVTEVTLDRLLSDRQTKTPDTTIRNLELLTHRFSMSRHSSPRECLVGKLIANQIWANNEKPLVEGQVLGICSIGGVPIKYSSSLDRRGVKLIGNTQEKKTKPRHKGLSNYPDRTRGK